MYGDITSDLLVAYMDRLASDGAFTAGACPPHEQACMLLDEVAAELLDNESDPSRRAPIRSVLKDVSRRVLEAGDLYVSGKKFS